MFYLIKSGQVNGAIEGWTDNPNLEMPGFEVIEGVDAPVSEIYLEDRAIKVRSPQPSPAHYWDAEKCKWIELPALAAINAPSENWQGLEDDLRGSEAWAQVFEAAGRTVKANRDFTFLYGTLTQTHNVSDLKMAIASIRQSMRGISGIGDFKPEILKWLCDRLEANGFDPSQFDLKAVEG